MTDPYIIIRDQNEYLTVQLPSLYVDKYWEFKPNHTPDWDNDNCHLLEMSTNHLTYSIVYPDNFKYPNLLTYLQAEQPELLV